MCITILKQQKLQKHEQSDVCTDLDKRPAMAWVEAKTNKIWVGPQLDDNGDMVEGHYKYTVITPGHWDMKNDGHE
jgi:hypothetical protein